MRKINFIEVTSLMTRGAVEGEENRPVNGTLLRGEECIATWTEEKSRGCDVVSIFPAVYNGEKAWLKRMIWDPAPGYNAWGTQECVVPFQKGVELLLSHNIFDFE